MQRKLTSICGKYPMTVKITKSAAKGLEKLDKNIYKRISCIYKKVENNNTLFHGMALRGKMDLWSL